LLERAIRGAAPPIAERERSEIPSPFLDFSMVCSQESFAPFVVTDSPNSDPPGVARDRGRSATARSEISSAFLDFSTTCSQENFRVVS
jgi:hypothetical protein